MTQSIATKITLLRQKIQTHNRNYYTLDAPTVTDAEYDRLIKSLRELEEKYPEYTTTNSPSQTVGGPVLEAFSKVQHEL
ncbi:MAG: NAD-dependent DNA ligase LigA, partial [Thiotrichaceae bacterium]|nr:NAD-dependent DNA ligase LigA [Thiotrichaceae bacterium]